MPHIQKIKLTKYLLFFYISFCNIAYAWNQRCKHKLLSSFPSHLDNNDGINHEDRLQIRFNKILAEDTIVKILPYEQGRQAKVEFTWRKKKYQIQICNELDAKLEGREVDRLWPPQGFARIAQASDGSILLAIEGISQFEFSIPGGAGRETLNVKKISLYQVDLEQLKLIPLDSIIYNNEWESFRFTWFDGQLSIEDKYQSYDKVIREIDLEQKRFRKRDPTPLFSVAARYDKKFFHDLPPTQ
jgi:hypothetical protein